MLLEAVTEKQPLHLLSGSTTVFPLGTLSCMGHGGFPPPGTSASEMQLQGGRGCRVAWPSQQGMFEPPHGLVPGTSGSQNHVPCRYVCPSLTDRRVLNHTHEIFWRDELTPNCEQVTELITKTFFCCDYMIHCTWTCDNPLSFAVIQHQFQLLTSSITCFLFLISCITLTLVAGSRNNVVFSIYISFACTSPLHSLYKTNLSISPSES